MLLNNKEHKSANMSEDLYVRNDYMYDINNV